MPAVWPGAGTSRGIDPRANGVFVPVAVGIVELATLDIDRLAGEEVVAAAMVGVQVRVDDDVDAGEVEVLLAQGIEAGIECGHHRLVQLRHAGVDEYACIGMVDDMHIDRHHLAFDMQVGNEDWRDGD